MCFIVFPTIKTILTCAIVSLNPAKLSTDIELNTGLEEDYYISSNATENEEERNDDDDSFDDTFSEKSCDIEVDEVDNEDFDMLLKEELNINFKQVCETPATDDTQDTSNGTQDTSNVVSAVGVSKEIPTPVKSAAVTLQHMAKISSSDSVDVQLWDMDHSTGRSDQSTMHRYNYEEAWKNREFMDQQKVLLNESVDLDNPLTFNIDCESCYGNVPGVIQVLHYKREVEYKYSTAMFCTSFVNSFVQLIAHDSHNITPPYHSSDTVIKAIICSNPNSPPTYLKDLEQSVTDLVTVAFNDTHFVVLRFCIKDHTVVVLDGLNYRNYRC